MDRTTAHNFLMRLAAFEATGLKIVDRDDYRGKVELQTPNGDRFWKTNWEAAKMIEAYSNDEPEEPRPDFPKPAFTNGPF